MSIGAILAMILTAIMTSASIMYGVINNIKCKSFKFNNFK